MGNRSYRRLRKFYENQVEQLLGLLDEHFKEGQLDLETYYKICEQKGIEPDPAEMPPSMQDYPYEVQVAFFIHHLLPDRWDGMSGSYFGKDMAALGALLDIYEIEDKRNIIYWIKQIEARNTEKINKKLEAKRKSKERQAKGSGINSANITRR